MVGGCPVDELAQPAQLGGRVRVAPAFPEVGVVLGGVDVHVLLGAAVEVELAQPLGVGPRGAVEALDDAAQLGRGPVADRDLGQALAGEELAEGLGGVEGAGGVGAGESEQGAPRVAAGGQDVPLRGQPGRGLDAQPPQRALGRRVFAGAADIDGESGGGRAFTGRDGDDPVGPGRPQRGLDDPAGGGVGVRPDNLHHPAGNGELTLAALDVPGRRPHLGDRRGLRGGRRGGGRGQGGEAQAQGQQQGPAQTPGFPGPAGRGGCGGSVGAFGAWEARGD